MQEHEHAIKNTSETKPAHDEVARKAYAIYLKEGRQQGRDVQNWLQAQTNMPHAGPDHHAHMAADFRKRFWISLVLTLPIMPRCSERSANADKTTNMFGTTLRSWDPMIQAWRISWTNPVIGHREDQIGRRSGKGIVQIGTRADGTKTRWTFTEITADSFHWLGEALQLDAITWKLEGEFRAKRRTTKERT
jgi:DUF2934 family protein